MDQSITLGWDFRLLFFAYTDSDDDIYPGGAVVHIALGGLNGLFGGVGNKDIPDAGRA